MSRRRSGSPGCAAPRIRFLHLPQAPWSIGCELALIKVEIRYQHGVRPCISRASFGRMPAITATERDKINQTTTSRCTRIVIPTLVSGEQLEIVEAVQIGKVSAKRRAAIMAAVSIATAGTVMVALKPRAYYLVLTNQRLILLENLRAGVGRIVAVAPRNAISSERTRAHLPILSMIVTIDGTPQRFSWGRFPGWYGQARSNGPYRVGAWGPAVPW